MPHCIARVFERLLRLLLPAPGRHRAADTRPAVSSTEKPAVPLPRAPRADTVPFLRGEDTALVRPYLIAHEQRQEEARHQRRRRRALWLAVHGVDVGPRLIHGVEVAV